MWVKNLFAVIGMASVFIFLWAFVVFVAYEIKDSLDERRNKKKCRLKNCPVCGNAPVTKLYFDGMEPRYRCSCCGHRTAAYDDYKDMMDEWNSYVGEKKQNG